MRKRSWTFASTLLAGVFMGGILTIQALPRLAPMRILGEAATALVFAGTLTSGVLIGMVAPSVKAALVASVASIAVGLAVAGIVLMLPVGAGIAGQLEMVSIAIAQRMLVLVILLVPVGVLGAFIGCAGS